MPRGGTGCFDLSSTIYAVKPGDGSAREQAASCQRVLLGGANITVEYATKRYRSNLINWGMVPFVMVGEPDFAVENGENVLRPRVGARCDTVRDFGTFEENAVHSAVRQTR